MSDTAEILRALAASDSGLTVTELVGVIGASDTKIRRGLTGLVAAGTVASSKDAPLGPGRPSLRFRPASRAGDWPVLVRNLLVAVWDEPGIPAELRAQMAAACGARISEDKSVQELMDAMAGLGFEPSDETTPDEANECRLRVRFHACPFANTSADQAADTVCLMHEGLLKGMLTEIGGALESMDFQTPAHPGCELRAVLWARA